MTMIPMERCGTCAGCKAVAAAKYQARVQNWNDHALRFLESAVKLNPCTIFSSTFDTDCKCNGEKHLQP